MMAADVSLLEKLAAALPKDLNLRVYHISTRPTSVDALFSAPSEQEEQKTFCESHLLSVALPPGEDFRELLVFALEVIVFTSETLTTIFVSKADSTGFLNQLKLDKSAGSIAKSLTTTFLRFLVDSRLGGPRVVLSLFARAQNQYLFPGSVEYSGKHVLDDHQLIKWWCKTLDPIIKHPTAESDSDFSDTTAYLVVPGCDHGETRAYFPPSAKQEPLTNSKWNPSYPMELLAPNRHAPLRCLIPRLPDDPKARFLTDLDDSKDDTGYWRSVKTMEQFWELMSFRQECSAGRLVGFVWVVFGPQLPNSERASERAAKAIRSQAPSKNDTIPTPGQSQVSENNVSSALKNSTDALEEIVMPGSPPPSSPVLPARDADPLDASEPAAEAKEQFYDDAQTMPVSWPRETRGEVVITSDQYDILIEYLLQLDFSTKADAEKSTNDFTTTAAEFAGKPWGRSVTGSKMAEQGIVTNDVPRETAVNVLMGVRKKRKAEVVEEKVGMPDSTVNVLGAGLVRKKAKA